MSDAKECEQAKSGECCYCKNMAYHKLEQTLLEIEHIIEKVKSFREEMGYCGSCTVKRLDEALQKIKAARE